MKEAKGLIIIYDKEGKEVAVDRWADTQDRSRLWESWCDVLLRMDRDGKQPMAIKEFMGDDHPDWDTLIAGKTDKQLGLLMSMYKPEREVDSTQLRYAERNEACIYDIMEVEKCIKADPHRYGRFEDFSGRVLKTLNSGLSNVEVDKCRAERMFEFKGGFSFTADNVIEGNEDVAWLFRKLSDKAVENAFVTLQDQEGRSIIIQLGIGNINSTMMDIQAIIEAAKRFDATKIWFIHNHPSGEIYASAQDMDTYKKLKECFGDRLQDAIIIDTDRGVYGTFNLNERTQHDFLKEEFNESQEIGQFEIPVYSFDKMLYKKRVMDKEDKALITSYHIASWLSTHRFGERGRYGFLALNNNLNVMGNFLLPTDDISNGDELAEYITHCCIRCNACNCVVYGDPEQQMILPRTIPANLSHRINRLSAGSVKMLDFIEMDDGQMICSYNDDGKIYDCANGQKYFNRVEVIPAGKDTILLRGKVDGEWMPAKELKGEYRRKYDAGEIDKYTLAEKFLREDVTMRRMAEVAGFKR